MVLTFTQLYPAATNFHSTTLQQDEALFRQLCEACDIPLTLCTHLIPKAFKMPDLGRRHKALDAVKKIAAQSSDDNAKFLRKQIEDQSRLAEAQVSSNPHLSLRVPLPPSLFPPPFPSLLRVSQS